jgi:hypothetical protein
LNSLTCRVCNLLQFEKEEVNGIVIDVRNCLGGQFKEALLTAGMFVKPTDKLINVLDASGFIKEKRGLYQTDMDRWPDTDGRPPTNVPRDKAVVLLTNRGSASSSEVLVAAIADNRSVSFPTLDTSRPRITMYVHVCLQRCMFMFAYNDVCSCLLTTLYVPVC